MEKGCHFLNFVGKLFWEGGGKIWRGFLVDVFVGRLCRSFGKRVASSFVPRTLTTFKTMCFSFVLKKLQIVLFQTLKLFCPKFEFALFSPKKRHIFGANCRALLAGSSCWGKKKLYPSVSWPLFFRQVINVFEKEKFWIFKNNLLVHSLPYQIPKNCSTKRDQNNFARWVKIQIM